MLRLTDFTLGAPWPMKIQEIRGSCELGKRFGLVVMSALPSTPPAQHHSAAAEKLKNMRLVRYPSDRFSNGFDRDHLVGRVVTLMAVRCGFRRLRYAAVSISLFGLFLSLGTWGFEAWRRSHPIPALLPLGSIDFIWTLGVFCWLLGLLMFIIAWVAPRATTKREQ